MTSLCNTFQRLALDTWDKIYQSRQVNFQLKEETLTDLNMLAIKTRHPNQVRTKVFTKPDEGKNGADWEWWFKGITNNWIGFRVQAKIINIESNKFEHLHYCSEIEDSEGKTIKEYQCDKLIKNALVDSKSHKPLIPLYCLFVQADNNLHDWHCGTFPFVKDLYGCSLISAFQVQKYRNNNNAKKHLDDIKNNLKPWHCLVCCEGYGCENDLISNIQAYAKAQLIPQDNQDNNVQKIPQSFITKNPPGYVLEMLENENNDNVQPPDKEIDGVIVIMEQ